ncbi:hypothetical protein HY991_01300 [Candidatus Micrarchaeota archaeon]|nr:hypothetical protein [Candidatus Micrarchaeota archaeon]
MNQRPRVLEVKEKQFEERKPPSETEFNFIEIFEPEKKKRKKGLTEKIKRILGLKEPD